MRKVFIVAVCFLAFVAIIFTTVMFTAYPLKYKREVASAADLYDIDKVLLASVINTESGFRSGAVSPKGATGLMQIMPRTADYIAGKLNLTDYDLYDPETNILMGAYYLRYLIDKFGDTRTALIAYNAGEGNVQSWLLKSGASALKTSPYKETNKYVERVLNGMSFYRFRL